MVLGVPSNHPPEQPAASQGTLALMPENDPEFRRRLVGPWVPRGPLFLPPALPQRLGEMYSFDGMTGSGIDRIFPVIVTVHSMPESTLVWRRIHKKLADRELLGDAGVERLQLMDVEEVEILEPILHQGVSVLDIIEARAADPERRNIGFKNSLIAKYGEGRTSSCTRSSASSATTAGGCTSVNSPSRQ